MGCLATNTEYVPSDFENPYAPAPFNDADDYPQYLGETRGGYDSVEEISDNEVRRPVIVYSPSQHLNRVCSQL